MIGGSGEDSFSVNGKIKNSLFVYDRSDESNRFPPKSQLKLETSADPTVNVYDKKDFIYDRFSPLMLAGFNNDQGFALGTGFLRVKQGFRKVPYAQRQVLEAHYSLGRKSFYFSYKADFREMIGRNDLWIVAESKGPNNVSNFFGVGNETQFPDKDNKTIDYYRTRYDLVTATIGLKRMVARNFSVRAGLTGQYYTSNLEDNASNFLHEYHLTHPEDNVFRTKYYGGAMLGAEWDSRQWTSRSEVRESLFWLCADACLSL